MISLKMRPALSGEAGRGACRSGCRLVSPELQLRWLTKRREAQ